MSKIKDMLIEQEEKPDTQDDIQYQEEQWFEEEPVDHYEEGRQHLEEANSSLF